MKLWLGTCILFFILSSGETRIYDEIGLLRAIKKVPPSQVQVMVKVKSKTCSSLFLRDTVFDSVIEPSSRNEKWFVFKDLPNVSSFKINSNRVEGCKAEVVKIE